MVVDHAGLVVDTRNATSRVNRAKATVVLLASADQSVA